MEVFSFFLLIVILVVLFINNSSLNDKIDFLKKRQELILKTLDVVSKDVLELKSKPSPEVTITPPFHKPPIYESKPEIIPIVEPTIKPVFEQLVTPITIAQDPILEPEIALFEKPIPAYTTPPKQPIAHKPTFFERNPDLEKFIGENLINKIGIAILVLGIGFFVKYAIDQQWINEIGRVAIGILCGGILLGIAHTLRNTFKPFSSVLVGGGLSVFYFTISIAFHDYHIFSKEVAFGLMVVITGFAILLAIAYNRIELALLAIIGGYSSPFFVSDGSGSYVIMFVYVSILNIGMLVLAYFKRWNLVNIVCFAFTVLLFSGWLSTKVIDVPDAPNTGALIFGTLFFVIFFLMNIINNVKENRKFVAFDISLLLSNNVFYYSAGMLILKNIDHGAYQGLFTALVGLFNLVFAYVLYTTKKADKNLVYLLIGLVLTFASLAAPVQLEGNYITMFWALEAVLLLWLSQKSGIQLIKGGSILVTVLMLISLLMDWTIYLINSEETLPFFLNKGFVTSILAIASLASTLFLLKNEGKEYLLGISTSDYYNIVTAALAALVYFSFLLEFNHQADHRLVNEATRILYLGSYNLVCASVCMCWLKKKSYPIISAVLTGVLGFTYIIYYNFAIADVRNLVLTNELLSLHYYYHYLMAGLMLVPFYFLSKIILKQYSISSKNTTAFMWVTSSFIIYLFSAELEHLMVFGMYIGGDQKDITDIQYNVFRIGFPILWGICSFFLMYLGMKKKLKTLRIISLSAFGLTLLKLFIFDVSKMNEGGKIAAFISLGVLLLIISFMYQKLKKLIIEDEVK